MALIHTQEEEGSLDGKLRGLEEGGMQKGKRAKKGHVRWGSQVQGGSLELETRSMQDAHTQNQKAEPSTPSPTIRSTSPRWDSGKGKNEGNLKLELDFSSRERLRVNPLGNVGKAKSSPMAKEFKGDPLGKGKAVRVWEDEGREEGHRKRSHSLLVVDQ